MRSDLLEYYERELSFLRQMGAEFADKYPKVASRLQLEPDKCEDPHVERLLEAFAFLAARVRLKIDDEFPEITESLLGILYPTFLAPVPSMSVVQFVLNSEQVSLQTGQTIPKGSTLASAPVDGIPCRFRTAIRSRSGPSRCEPPASNRRPRSRSGAATRGRCSTSTCASWEAPPCPSSRRSPSTASSTRSRASASTCRAKARSSTRSTSCSSTTRSPSSSGRGPRRPTPRRSRWGRRLSGRSDSATTRRSCRRRTGSSGDTASSRSTSPFRRSISSWTSTGSSGSRERAFTDTLDVRVLLGRPFAAERSVSAQTFRLHATPVVNLFSQMAEPIRVTHLSHEYRVIPNLRRPAAHEVWSVDSVTSTSADVETVRTYQPFFAFRHDAERAGQQALWHASRRPSERKDDEGTEVFLTLVDLELRSDRARHRHPHRARDELEPRPSGPPPVRQSPKATSSSRGPGSSPRSEAS